MHFVLEKYAIAAVALRQYAVFVQRTYFKVSRFGVTQFTKFIQFIRFTELTQFTKFTQFMFYLFFGKVLLLPYYMPLLP